VCHPEKWQTETSRSLINLDDEFWKSHEGVMARFANFHASMDRLEALSKELTDGAYQEYLAASGSDKSKP
jgi:hypothetical protein